MKQEKGQILPMAAILLAAAIVGIGALLGMVTSVLADESKAQTAADAAALAGAASGREAAELAAQANGASLVELTTFGSDAVVRTKVGNAEAQARARRSGGVETKSSRLAR